jgi:hypothetical protein
MSEAVQAVLVDGVGNTREMTLSHRLHNVRVPLWQRMSLSIADTPRYEPMPVADFNLIGDLPDGRTVYGFQFGSGPRYELWRVEACWVASAPPKAIEAAAHEVEHNIDALVQHGRPVRLYDAVTIDKTTQVKTRTVMGLGRRTSSGG